MFHVKHKRSEISEYEFWDASKLMDLFCQAGLYLSPEQVEAFRIYWLEILRWNKKIHLISRKDEKRIIERHFLESALLIYFEEINSAQQIMDLGSGAGFPGIPLKILKPEVKMTLLDSNRMKTLFLKNVVEKLRFHEVEIICDRVENLSKDKRFFQKFNNILARAVAPIHKIYPFVEPLLKESGCLTTMKGENWETEIELLKKMNCKIQIDIRTFSYSYLLKNENLKILFIKKTSYERSSI